MVWARRRLVNPVLVCLRLSTTCDLTTPIPVNKPSQTTGHEQRRMNARVSEGVRGSIPEMEPRLPRGKDHM
ncbi:hypothetical protein Tco_1271857, partial [Tanacetum coccineum]